MIDFAKNATDTLLVIDTNAIVEIGNHFCVYGIGGHTWLCVFYSVLYAVFVNVVVA